MSNIINLFSNKSTILTANTIEEATAMPSEEVRTAYNNQVSDFFTVESHDLHSEYGKIEGKKGLFVNEKNINIVSDKYEVHQPVEIYKQFEEVAKNTNLRINKVLTNEANGGLLINAFYDDCKIVGEDHDIQLNFYTSHDGKYKTFLTLDLLRIACMNQVPSLYRNKERHIFAEKHYQNALDIQLIGELLTHIPESVAAQNEKSELLSQKALSASQFVELFVEHYKLKETQARYDAKINKAREIYNHAVGQRGLSETAYKAYNAITYMNTHEVRQTAMTEENKLTVKAKDSISFMDRLLAA